MYQSMGYRMPPHERFANTDPAQLITLLVCSLRTFRVAMQDTGHDLPHEHEHVALRHAVATVDVVKQVLHHP